MKITEAISILKIHQEWRLGADIVSIEPKELTEAMQVVIDHHIVDTNKRVSSVEWLLSNISSKIDNEYWCNQKEITEFVEQAKAMHKEEIENAWYNGYLHQGEMFEHENVGEEFYKETFGGNNEQQ